MESQRQPYIPAPPPSISQPAPQAHVLSFPPPPPRLPHPSSHAMVPPPPPGPPPGSTYGLQSGWQQNWGRQPGIAQTFPPPPPPMLSSNQAQNQHLAYSVTHSRQPAPLSIPLPPPLNDNQPLTSATYIPGRESFGPGVGIPPLFTHDSQDTFSRQEQYGYSVENDNSRHGPNQPYHDGTMQPNPLTRSHQLPLPLRDSQDPLSPGPPTATIQNPQPPGSIQNSELSLIPSSSHHPNGSTTSIMSSNEADRWTLDRVLAWLAQNEFSNDWQETFRVLELQGADFIELGRGANGRGNLSMMHQIVYPQLAKECTKSGTGWDQPREREEGKRMRKLIRRIADNNSIDGGGLGSRYWDSTQVIPSASTDGGLENSPNLGRDLSGSMPSDNSPGQPISFKPLAPSFAQRQYPGQRGATMGGAGNHDSTSIDFVPLDSSSHPRSEYSRNVFNMIGERERRRHSPSTSSDTGIPPSLIPGEDNTQRGSPASQFASVTQAESAAPAGDVNGKFEHNKRYSSDSTTVRSIASHGYFANQGSMLRGGMGGAPGEVPVISRSNESRRIGQETSRPSPQDQSMRQGAADAPYAREHSKGFLNMFRKKKGYDSIHPSPEEVALDSPTSPVSLRQPPPSSIFGRPGFNGSDMSLERPSSSSVSDHEKAQSRTGKVMKMAKKYVFATPDGWNYRLIDVTDIDAADSLRAVLCHSLGIMDAGNTLIYLTEAGQVVHDEPLSDTMLVVNRRSRSDSLGTLKFFVHTTLTPPTGLGLSFTDAALSVNHGQRKPTEEESRNRPSQNSHPRALSPHRGSQQSILKGVSNSSANAQGRSLGGSTGDGGSGMGESFETGGDAALLAAREEQRRENERKQRAYLQPKQDQLQKKEALKGSIPGIKRDGVIDFDSPRISPFEERKPDTLVPLRRPPSAPAESSTLAKVNSLRKSPGEKTRNSSEIQIESYKRMSGDFIAEERGIHKFTNAHSTSSSAVQGLGAALASVGKIPGAIGKPSVTAPLDQSLHVRTEAGTGKSLLMQPVDFSNGSSDQRSSGDVPNIALVQEMDLAIRLPQRGRSPAASPSSERLADTPMLQPRKTPGPDFDFQEAEVSFERHPLPQEESDEDSDEGLFAIPLVNSKNNSQGKKLVKATEAQTRSVRPALTVNTGSRAAKSRSVTFKSPSTSGDPSTGLSTQSADSSQSELQSLHKPGDGEIPESSSVDNTSSHSPEDSRFSRRDSFARDDIWASRPPIEGVIDHLDDFFPNIDLDEPYLEGNATSPPVSPAGPSSRPDIESEASNLRERVPHGSSTLGSQVSQESSDTLGSDESTLKARGSINSFAQRSIARSVVLGRMKSIREVAKGAHQISRNQSVAPSTGAKSGAILRRKSTKMFGGKIMQISPKPGSRLSQLDPIPQNTVLQDKMPQRQPTFRIIRGQLIGKGTFGRVYLGINAETGEVLAVKQVEVNQKAAGNDKDKMKEMATALNQEIDTMQHLEHPNIVQYLGCDRGELSISIYLEYISGGSIGSCLRKHGKFEESVVKSLTIQTLSGLAYLHDQGILHRDLKADNILLDVDGTCKISDFGISKRTDNIYGNDASNLMQGSVFWMAPEVVQSRGQGYSAKVDIWSVGCVVLEMFAGRRPWEREEAIGAIFKLGSLNQAPPIPEDVSVAISPGALAFMYDCFTIDTFDRPTAATLLSQHPFCIPDPRYNFEDTELYAKIRHVL